MPARRRRDNTKPYSAPPWRIATIPGINVRHTDGAWDQTELLQDLPLLI
jgi:hypothetical protein